MYSKKLKKFQNIINRFKNGKVLVIGDVMLDRFVWGTVSRISPEAPVPVVLTKSESFMPGGASNVATNIRAFGAEAYMCGVVGDDEDGRILMAELAKKGINNEGIFIDNKRPTVHKTRIIAHHQQLVRIDKESEDTLQPNIINRIIAFAKNKIKDIDVIILEDYGKGVMVPRLIKEMVSIAKRHKKIVMVDPKLEHLSLYKSVTSITPNRKEAESASGVKIKNLASLKSAGKKLLKLINSESVLITLGEDGMALFGKRNSFIRIPTVAQEVYDVSGAGDTVIAVFSLAVASGATLTEAAHIANIAAGVVVGKLGIAACNKKELESHLNQITRYGIKQKQKAGVSDSIFENTYK